MWQIANKLLIVMFLEPKRSYSGTSSKKRIPQSNQIRTDRTCDIVTGRDSREKSPSHSPTWKITIQ